MPRRFEVLLGGTEHRHHRVAVAVGRGQAEVRAEAGPQVRRRRRFLGRLFDDALQALATFDERKSRVIELRYFGGLSVEETAVTLRVSADTVMRDWRLAKAWLYQEMKRRPKR